MKLEVLRASFWFCRRENQLINEVILTFVFVDFWKLIQISSTSKAVIWRWFIKSFFFNFTKITVKHMCQSLIKWSFIKALESYFYTFRGGLKNTILNFRGPWPYFYTFREYRSGHQGFFSSLHSALLLTGKKTSTFYKKNCGYHQILRFVFRPRNSNIEESKYIN